MPSILLVVVSWSVFWTDMVNGFQVRYPFSVGDWKSCTLSSLQSDICNMYTFSFKSTTLIIDLWVTVPTNLSHVLNSAVSMLANDLCDHKYILFNSNQVKINLI